MRASIITSLSLASLVVASHFNHAQQHNKRAEKLVKRVNRRQATEEQPVLLLAQAPDNSTLDSNGTLPSYNATALWFNETGKQGACLYTNTDADLIVGLPIEFWNDTSAPSPYCGQSLFIECPATGKNITAMIADASGKEFVTLTIGSFEALGGILANGELNVTYTFLNSTSPNSTYSGNDFSTSRSAPIAALALLPLTISMPSIAPSSSTAAPTATPSSSSSYDNGAAYASSQAAASASSQAAAASSQAAAAASSAKASAKKAADAAAASASAQAAAASPPSPTQNALAPVVSLVSAIISGGFGTYYYQNGVAGNCGTVSLDSEYVIAMPTVAYANGAHCGKKMKITRVDTGKSAIGTVMDSCPTCNNNESMDMSVAMFTSLAAESVGLFDITYQFV